jgi:Uma2 family endonuclease
MRLMRALAPMVPSQLEVNVEFTVRLGKTGLVEPDLIVCLPQAPNLDYVAWSDVRLAIEVADTSLARDLRKAQDYGAAGLPELWIADLDARQTLIFLTVNGAWAEQAPIAFDQPIAALCLPDAALLIAPLTE